MSAEGGGEGTVEGVSGVRDGGGTEFPRVLETLWTRIADGTYALATHLPSQRALTEEFGVSRDTVQRVLRELNNEGWIKSVRAVDRGW